jgi:hypothetical protein
VFPIKSSLIVQWNCGGFCSRRMKISWLRQIIVRERIPFAGVVYAHQLRVSIGTCVHELELIAKVADAEDLADRVEYLPL